MTRNGFIVANNTFVKIRDELGMVNYTPNASFKEDDLKKAINEN